MGFELLLPPEDVPIGGAFRSNGTSASAILAAAYPTIGSPNDLIIGSLGGSVLRTSRVIISVAEMNALNTVPKIIVPAVVGYTHIPFMAWAFQAIGGTAFSGLGTLNICYNGAPSLPISGDISLSNAINRYLLFSVPIRAASYGVNVHRENTALAVYSSIASTLGSGSFGVQVLYSSEVTFN